ncbi:MAG: hypothetical protein AAF591_14005 [Verrucomicrobiota bacterium]
MPSQNSHSHPKTQAQSPTEAPRPGNRTLRLEAHPADLPKQYPDTTLWSVAREPRCLFAYWNLSPAIPSLPGLTLALLVTRNKKIEALYRLQKNAGSRFIPISQPDASYQVTLCFLPPSSIQAPNPANIILHRNVTTPRNTPLTPPTPTTTPPTKPNPDPPTTPLATTTNNTTHSPATTAAHPHTQTNTPTPKPSHPPTPSSTPVPILPPTPTPTPPQQSNPTPHLPPHPASPESTKPKTDLPLPLFTIQNSTFTIPLPLPDSLAARPGSSPLGYPDNITTGPAAPVHELLGFRPELA